MRNDTLSTKPMIFFYFFILSFALHINAQTSTWYVDNAASGANNGTSWTDGWQSLADIQWGSIQPGDTILISGGADGSEKTYAEALTIKASGNETERITIQVGQEAGHNGTVVITGNQYWGILFDGSGMSVNGYCHYVTVSGQVGTGNECKIRVSDPDDSGIYIRGISSNFIIEYIEIAYNGADDAALGENGNAEIMGITEDIDSSIPIRGEIRFCRFHENDADDIHMTSSYQEIMEFGRLKIHHCEFYQYNDDCIEVGINGVDIYNNVFHDRDAYRSGHPDNIQSYGSYVRVYNNYFYNMLRTDSDEGNCNLYFHPTPATTGSHCSHLYAYNNVFYEDRIPPAGTCGAVQMGFGYGITSLSDVVLVNNTAIGSWGSALTIEFADLGSENIESIIIENNIFTDCARFPMLESAIGFAGDGNLIYGPHGSDSDVIVDYNVYHGEKADYLYYGGEDRRHTYEEFKINTGCQEHDVTTDPELDPVMSEELGVDMNNHKPINETAPVVDTGIDLSAFLNMDDFPELNAGKAGIVRSADAWDIGAFEYDLSESHILLQVKVFLEGPYLSQSMNTNLLVNGHLPFQSPYDTTSVSTFPDNVVDWVQVELRTLADGSGSNYRKSVFVRNDGQIVNLDGSEEIQITAPEDNYFIVVMHRNHLCVMSHEAVNIPQQ